MAQPHSVHCQWYWRSFNRVTGDASSGLAIGGSTAIDLPTYRAGSVFSDIPFAAVHDVQLGAVSSGRVRDYHDYAATELAAAVGHCDLFLCFERRAHPSTTALLRALKPKRSIGLLPGFDIEIPFDRKPHAIDLAFAIAMELAEDLRIEDFAAPPRLPHAALALARKLRGDLPREAVLLVVHADTKPDKAWPRAKLAQALDEFLERHRQVVAIVVGTDAFEVDVGRNRGRILSCHGVPLSVAFAVIGVCDLFLGIDSCMLHLADLYQVPGVGLFGTTDPSEFGFRFARHLHVRAATMNEISVADVGDALEARFGTLYFRTTELYRAKLERVRACEGRYALDRAAFRRLYRPPQAVCPCVHQWMES